MPKIQKAKKRAQKPAAALRDHKPHIISFFIMTLFLGITFALVFLLKQEQDPRTSAAVNLINCAVSATDEAIESEEQVFLALLNAYRQQNGRDTVKFSSNLNRAAAWMSNDMLTKNYFEHTDSFNRQPFQRIADCGYAGLGTGENIATGQETAQEALDAWKASASHNQVMLNPTYTVIGIARSGGLWTLDLGTTDDSAPSPTATGTVPSPVCGGSTNNACPTEPVPTTPQPTTIIPTQVTPTQIPTLPQPTDTPIPTPTIEPTITESPTPTTTTPTTTVAPTPPASGQPANGIINLLLQLMLALLALLAGLLGR